MPPMIRCSKKRGEWAELQFMARAAAHGLTVAKPWGESSRFDFIVESAGKLHRVQVKSTTHRIGRSYICNLRKDNAKYRRRYPGKLRPYTTRQIDFLAVYIVPENLWYIIPASLACSLVGNIWLTPAKLGHRHQRYLEAWHLFRAKKSKGNRTADCAKAAGSRS